MADAPPHAAWSARWRALIRDVPDFPQPGIVFRDITPLLWDSAALRAANDALAASAIGWLTGRRFLVGTPPKTPEQVRVVLTAEQLGRLFWVCVLGIPGLVALAVGSVVWWRRRGRPA